MNNIYRVYHCPNGHVVELDTHDFPELNKCIEDEIIIDDTIYCPHCDEFMKYVGIITEKNNKKVSRFYKVIKENSAPQKFDIIFNYNHMVNYETGDIID